jgi:hypothetical protein
MNFIEPCILLNSKCVISVLTPPPSPPPPLTPIATNLFPLRAQCAEKPVPCGCRAYVRQNNCEAARCGWTGFVPAVFPGLPVSVSFAQRSPSPIRNSRGFLCTFFAMCGCALVFTVCLAVVPPLAPVFFCPRYQSFLLWGYL